MGSQLEASLQHDMNLIRQSVREMAEQCARALRGAMDALAARQAAGRLPGHPAGPAYRRTRAAGRSPGTGVHGAPAARRRAPALRLRRPEDQHGAGADRRPRGGRRPSGPQAPRDPPRDSRRAVQRDGRGGAGDAAGRHQGVPRRRCRTRAKHDARRAGHRQDAAAHRQGPDGCGRPLASSASRPTRCSPR